MAACTDPVSQTAWRDMVEKTSSDLSRAITACDGTLSSVRSSKQAAERAPALVGGIQSATAGVLDAAAAHAERQHRAGEASAQALPTRRREVQAAMEAVRRLMDRIEDAITDGERGLRTLQRQHFGRYTAELEDAARAWQAQEAFLRGLLPTLRFALLTARESIARVERSHDLVMRFGDRTPQAPPATDAAPTALLGLPTPGVAQHSGGLAVPPLPSGPPPLQPPRTAPPLIPGPDLLKLPPVTPPGSLWVGSPPTLGFGPPSGLGGPLLAGRPLLD